MIREIDMNDEFASSLIAGAASSPPEEPRAFYNEEGDCIEFYISSESYYAERVDDLLTVYYGRDSGEIVGSLIKGVRGFLRQVMQAAPGFVIEVQDGRMRLEHIITAGMWHSGDEVIVKTYKKLRDAADEHQTQVNVPELV